MVGKIGRVAAVSDCHDLEPCTRTGDLAVISSRGQVHLASDFPFALALRQK